MQSSKKETLKKVDQEYLNGRLYLVDHFPTIYDFQLFETIREFNLASEFDAESHPNLFAWHCLLKMYSANVRHSWSAPDSGEDKDLEALLVSLRAETDEQAESRREKQQWENYVDPKDKRPEDEFFDL